MQERLGPSRRELGERERLLEAHGEACPYEGCAEGCHEELKQQCPFIKHWTRKLSYCMLYLEWCRVLHPEMRDNLSFLDGWPPE